MYAHRHTVHRKHNIECYEKCCLAIQTDSWKHHLFEFCVRFFFIFTHHHLDVSTETDIESVTRGVQTSNYSNDKALRKAALEKKIAEYHGSEK